MTTPIVDGEDVYPVARHLSDTCHNIQVAIIIDVAETNCQAPYGICNGSIKLKVTPVVYVNLNIGVRISNNKIQFSIRIYITNRNNS